MARRKKRKDSTDVKRLPLVFTDSPVSIVHGVPSPVFCSDHPPTADVVVIEDKCSYSWVSPQFTSIPQSGRARRGRKRKCSGNTTSTRLRDRSCIEASSSSLPRGMAPLRFVGQENSPPPSPIQELSVTMEDHIRTVRDTGRAVVHSPGTLRQISQSSNRIANRSAAASPTGPGDPHTPEPELCTPQACDIDTGSHLLPGAKVKTGGGTNIENMSKHIHDIDNTNQIETTADETSSPDMHVMRRRWHKSQCHRKCVLDRNNDSCVKKNESGRKMLCKCPKSCNVHKNKRNPDEKCLNYVNDIGSQGIGTQRRPQTAGFRHTAKRLFHNETAVGELENRDTNLQAATTISDPDISFRASVSESVCYRHDNRRRSARLASNTLLRDSLLQTPKERSDLLPFTVLAYDTPEEDYGVSVRERQLRKLNKLKRTKLKC